MMDKRIVKLAIPNIISNVTIPLLGLIDIAILGHLNSEVYLGAVALGTMIFSILYMSLGFLRMGTSGMTAQQYGARDFRAINTWFVRAVSVALGIAAFLILMQYPVASFTFWALDASSETEALARQYFHIRIFAAPATLINYVLIGWFVGMQNTKFTMWHTVFVNVMNIGLNFFFVMGLSMNVTGVAWGTVCAQYMGLFFGLGLILKYYYPKLKKYGLYSDVWEWKQLKQYFQINGDIFVRTVCLIATFSLFTAKSAGTNDVVLAANTILLQFLYFFSYLIDGFAYAAEALVGRYFGAGDRKNFILAVRRLFVWGVLLAFIFSLAYMGLYQPIIKLLTGNGDIVAEAMHYKYWIVLLPWVSFAAFLWDGIYIGSTATKEMRNAMLVSTLLIFLPVYYLGGSYWENHGLWLAIIIFMLARSLSLTFLFKKLLSRL